MRNDISCNNSTRCSDFKLWIFSVTEVKKKAVVMRIPQPSATLFSWSFYSLPGIPCRHHQNMFLDFSTFLILKKCLQLKEQNLSALYLTFVGLMCFKKDLGDSFIKHTETFLEEHTSENSNVKKMRRGSLLLNQTWPLRSPHTFLRRCWFCLSYEQRYFNHFSQKFYCHICPSGPTQVSICMTHLSDL